MIANTPARHTPSATLRVAIHAAGPAAQHRGTPLRLPRAAAPSFLHARALPQDARLPRRAAAMPRNARRGRAARGARRRRGDAGRGTLQPGARGRGRAMAERTIPARSGRVRRLDRRPRIARCARATLRLAGAACAATVNARLTAREGTLNPAARVNARAPCVNTRALRRDHRATARAQRACVAAKSGNEKSGLSFNVKRRLKFGWLNPLHRSSVGPRVFGPR